MVGKPGAESSLRCSTVVRRRDELLGFVTTLRDGDTAIAYYTEFDRAAAAEGLPIYLRLLHAAISNAISWGCKSLSLGRTALEPKAALGAKPEAMSVWLRHRMPAMNWIMRGLLGTVTHEEAPERNPFKINSKRRSGGVRPKPRRPPLILEAAIIWSSRPRKSWTVRRK